MGALSDLAAVGATPVGALVALCVPGGSGQGDLALGVMAGVAEASAASGCPVVGGRRVGGGRAGRGRHGARDDGDRWPPSGGAGGRTARGHRARDRALRRLGGGVAGAACPSRRRDGGGERRDGRLAEAHRRPVARLREGALARAAGAHAMIDVSDGLALDLHRLADASGVGFRLDTVPVAAGATEDEALGGGEDYELLIAIGRGDADALGDRCVAEGLRRPVETGIVVEDAGGAHAAGAAARADGVAAPGRLAVPGRCRGLAGGGAVR